MKGDERVLDLGCGDGVLTAQIAEHLPRGEVVGVDASPGMLEVARRGRGDNCRFELLDRNDLAYEAEFDVVFSNATLRFVKDHQWLLRNLPRRRSLGCVDRPTEYCRLPATSR